MNVPLNHSRLLQFAGILLAGTGAALVAGVAAELQRLIARLGPKEASRQLYMGLDVAPSPTQEQLTQALHGVVMVRIIPERTSMHVGVQPKKETEYVKQPAH